MTQNQTLLRLGLKKSMNHLKAFGLTDSKKKYVLVNSNQHAFPFLQPKETAAIINSYLEKLKNEKFKKKNF